LLLLLLLLLSSVVNAIAIPLTQRRQGFIPN
jgi:hypothetical protein